MWWPLPTRPKRGWDSQYMIYDPILARSKGYTVAPTTSQALKQLNKAMLSFHRSVSMRQSMFWWINNIPGRHQNHHTNPSNFCTGAHAQSQHFKAKYDTPALKTTKHILVEGWFKMLPIRFHHAQCREGVCFLSTRYLPLSEFTMQIHTLYHRKATYVVLGR